MSKTVNISPNSTTWRAYEYNGSSETDYTLAVASKNKVPFTGCTGCTITISGHHTTGGNYRLGSFAFKMVFPAVSKVVTLTVAEVS